MKGLYSVDKNVIPSVCKCKRLVFTNKGTPSGLYYLLLKRMYLALKYARYIRLSDEYYESKGVLVQYLQRANHHMQLVVEHLNQKIYFRVNLARRRGWKWNYVQSLVCSKLLLPVDPVLVWNTLSNTKGAAEANPARAAARKRNRNQRTSAIARCCGLRLPSRKRVCLFELGKWNGSRPEASWI